MDQFNPVCWISIRRFGRTAEKGRKPWPELFPCLDAKAVESAAKLALKGDPRALARLVTSKEEFARLVAALVRVQLARRHGEILSAAGRKKQA